MEVRIGVQHVGKELVIDSELTADEIQEKINKATAKGSSNGVLKLTDAKGAQVLVPVDRLAYIEIGPSKPNKVGFGF